MGVLEKVKEAREKSKPRKFTQSWDISINLRGIDLRKPENRLNLEFVLPEGRGKENRVAVIADSLAAEAKKSADLVISKAEIESLVKNKKKIKKIADEYDYFLGEAAMMPIIGRSLGAVLGPRGKMPKPVPPKIAVEPLVKRAKGVIRIALKESPVIHATIGTEDMDDEKVAKNITAVFDFVADKLPKGRNNIKSAFIKLTMGKPVKLEA
jgi:large subunit ribosomal protein L1